MYEKPILSTPIKRQTLADQMAETIQEAIIAGKFLGGDSLPTEPDLAEQFGVSRAVVRDGIRILMARGLVDVQHGRGMFVTFPGNEAFGEALLLALRRVGASAWDVEHFEQILFPEVIALAATNATDEEIYLLERKAKIYAVFISGFHHTWWLEEAPAEELERYMYSFQEIHQLIFSMTHNQVFMALARPLLKLRNLRDWKVKDTSGPADFIRFEVAYIDKLIKAISSRAPEKAREITRRLMELPPEAVTAMQNTPVGEISKIPGSPYRRED